MARVLVISFSDLARDSRLDRQIGWLLERHQVIAAGLAPPAQDEAEFVSLGPPASSSLAARTNQAMGAVRLAARRFDAAYWGNRMLAHAREVLLPIAPDLVVANDVIALPLGLEVAKGAPVVLDAHEHAPTEYEGVWWWRALLQPYMAHLTQRFVPRAAAVLTVSPGIADRYAAETGVQPRVLMNFPPHRPALRPAPVGSPVRLLHFGSAHPQRRLGTLVDTMHRLGDEFSLDLVLTGHDCEISRLRRRAGHNACIRFHRAIAPRELVPFANQFDVGVYALPPLHFNAVHALPNKLFEFIQARLAVVVGPSPAMADVVTNYGVGVVAEGFGAAELATALRGLGKEQIAAYKAASDRAAAVLSAERSGDVLHAAIDETLTRAAQERANCSSPRQAVSGRTKPRTQGHG